MGDNMFTVNMANNFKTNNRETNLKDINQKPAEQQFLFFKCIQDIRYIWFQNLPFGYKREFINIIVQILGIVRERKQRET